MSETTARIAEDVGVIETWIDFHTDHLPQGFEVLFAERVHGDPNNDSRDVFRAVLNPMGVRALADACEDYLAAEAPKLAAPKGGGIPVGDVVFPWREPWGEPCAELAETWADLCAAHNARIVVAETVLPTTYVDLMDLGKAYGCALLVVRPDLTITQQHEAVMWAFAWLGGEPVNYRAMQAAVRAA